jgi:hypothetical protein
MKMRQENNQSAQERKKDKSFEDFEGDIDDNESIESVSDDEFDKYLGKRIFTNPTVRIRSFERFSISYSAYYKCNGDRFSWIT